MDDSDFSLIYHLQKKQETLRSDYGANYTDAKIEETDLSSFEMAEFKRMCRWHTNSHIMEDQWLEAFYKISPSLDVKEKMEELDESFTQFLSEKFRNSTFKDGFNVTALLDILEDPIRELYESRINDRNLDGDDFDFDNITIGRKPEDTTFYERCFYPAALLFSYQQMHNDYQGKDTWEDVFTLGSGSKGYDLIPETNPVCNDCASVYFPNLKNLTSSEILDLNIQVFKSQKENAFNRPSIVKYLKKMQAGTLCESTSSDELKSEGEKQEISENLGRRPFNPFSDNGSESKDGFNPFSSDDSDSDEEITPNSCTICKKSFSEVEYLHYHNRVFHDKTSKNKTKIVVSKFVSDGEEMMTSFIAPEEVKENEPKKVEKESTIEVAKDSRELNLRRRSRRKLDM